jgi:hypothetical protein
MQPGASKTDMGAIDHTSEAIDVWAAELRMQFGGQSIAPAALTCRTEIRQASKARRFSNGEVRKAAARAEVRLNWLWITADPEVLDRKQSSFDGLRLRSPHLARRRLTVIRRLDRTLEMRRYSPIVHARCVQSTQTENWRSSASEPVLPSRQCRSRRHPTGERVASNSGRSRSLKLLIGLDDRMLRETQPPILYAGL